MDPLLWSILCCVLMIGVVVLEFWVPSFGLLTVTAAAFFLVGAYLAFQHSAAAGLVMLAVNLSAVAATILLTMQYMKSTPLSNREAIHPPAADPHPKKPSAPVTPHEWVGLQGRALTPLRPSGMAEFGERRVDVVTEGKFIERGAAVRILRVEGPRVVVEALEG